MDADTSLGTHTEQEIGSQADCWARVTSVPRIALEGSLALAGCGTSYYLLAAWGMLREATTGDPADAYIASQMPGRQFDTLAVLSRSGTTGELIDAVGTHRDRVGRTAAILGNPNSPLAQQVDDVVSLSFADEQSLVQTRFPTTALSYLRWLIGEDPALLVKGAQQVLESDVDPSLAAYDHMVFLGHGWASHLASEAALKVREGAQVFAEAYLANEYLHGPIALANSATLVWGLGPLDETIAQAIERTGARLVRSDQDPQVELVAIHRVMLAAARRKGVDPDHPRCLSRSVM